MSNGSEGIREILKKALRVELDGYTFYSMTADRSTKPTVQKLFAKLARDEAEHQGYLKAVMQRYEGLGVGGFFVDPRDPGMAEYSSQLFNDAFRREAEGETFELGVLSIGLQLEANAVAFFSGASREATDPQVSGFYRFLSDWEDLHYRTLKQLYDNVRADFESKPA